MLQAVTESCAKATIEQTSEGIGDSRTQASEGRMQQVSANSHVKALMWWCSGSIREAAFSSFLHEGSWKGGLW